MDALDASADRVVQLVEQIGAEQWDHSTPCSEWNVRTLVGHLIATMRGYGALLEGAPAAEFKSMLERQDEAAGPDPATTCQSAVRSVRVAFAEPGALERTVHHLIGDISGSQLLGIRIAENVVHSWDLATAIGVAPGLNEQLVELVYEPLAPIAQSGALYTTDFFAAPTRPLPQGATRLEQLMHLVGR